MILIFIVLSYLSLFVLGFSDNIRGPVFPKVLEQFQLSDGLGSWAFAIASIFAFVGSLVAGYVLRYYKKIQVLSLSLFMMGISMAGLALAPSFWFFLLASSLFGFSLGMMGVTQNTLVTIGSSPEKRGQVLSGLHAIYGLASLTAPLVVAYWFKLNLPWQLVFLVASLLAAVVLVVTLIWPGAEERIEKSQVQKSQSERGHIIAAVIFGAYVVAEIMVSSRLALYMTRIKGEDVEHASLMVTYFFILLLVGRLAMAFIKLPLSISTQLKMSLIGSLFFVLLGLNGWSWGFVLSGLTMAPFYPLAISYISLSFPSSVATAISKTMAVQNFLVVVMHFSVGYFAEMFGLKAALYVGPVFLLTSYVSLFYFEKKIIKKAI